MKLMIINVKDNNMRHNDGQLLPLPLSTNVRAIPCFEYSWWSEFNQTRKG